MERYIKEEFLFFQVHTTQTKPTKKEHKKACEKNAMRMRKFYNLNHNPNKK